MPAEHNKTLNCRVQVRWSDMDALGHVNNASYFTYLEEARMEWLRSLPEPWYDDDSGPVVARASCDFRLPITGTGPVLVTTDVARVGNSSLTLESRILSDTSGGDESDVTVYAAAEVILVWIDRRTGRACGLPDSLRSSVGA